jgi:hypothetical protein
LSARTAGAIILQTGASANNEAAATASTAVRAAIAAIT